MDVFGTRSASAARPALSKSRMKAWLHFSDGTRLGSFGDMVKCAFFHLLILECCGARGDGIGGERCDTKGRWWVKCSVKIRKASLLHEHDLMMVMVMSADVDISVYSTSV